MNKNKPMATTADDELGVLLVHGMGKSKQGEILSKWAKALLDTLEEEGAKVIALESRLRPSGHFASITSKIIPDGGKPFRLRIVEAWWAETFAPPSFISVFRWSLLAFPWTVVSHMDDRYRRTGIALDEALAGWRTKRDIHSLFSVGLHVTNVVVEVIWLFFSLLLAPLVLMLLILIGLLAWIPWGPVRSFVSVLLRILSGTLGDSYVFVENVVIRHAITDQILSAMQNVMAAGKVIVIAHSQGAAVTHYTLSNLQYRDDDAANEVRKKKIQRLITFGSGLRKLKSLTDRKDRHQSLLLAMVAILFAAIAAAVMFLSRPDPLGTQMNESSLRLDAILATIVLPFILNLFGLLLRTLAEPVAKRFVQRFDQRVAGLLNLGGLIVIIGLALWLWQSQVLPNFNELSFFIASCLGLSFTFLMYWRYAAGRPSDRNNHIQVERREWKQLDFDSIEYWVDVHAELDPVSNGPLLDNDSISPKLTTCEISNASNMLLDHTTYWRNKKQFVTPIAREILCSGTGSGYSNESTRIRFAGSATMLDEPTKLLFRLLSIGVLVVVPIITWWRYGDPIVFIGLPPLNDGLWLSIANASSWQDRLLVAASWSSWAVFGAALVVSHVILGRIKTKIVRRNRTR